MYRLLFEERTNAPAPFVTRETLLVIGRDASCQLRLARNGVSERHAAIEQRADGYYVRDLGAAVGVRVNGVRVDDQRLASGDEIELGGARLRFEVLQQTPPTRRPLDALSLTSYVIVSGLVIAQLVLFWRVLSEPRPRDLRVSTGKQTRTQPTNSPASSTQPLLPPLPVEPAAPPTPTAPAPESGVLDHMIRITRVERADSANAVTLTMQIKAQVGEREMDTRAVAISLQLFGAGQPGSPGGVVEKQRSWLKLPSKWENFSTQVFQGRYNGSPQQFAGYVVRTYYRGRLQDARAEPASLVDAAPVPLP